MFPFFSDLYYVLAHLNLILSWVRHEGSHTHETTQLRTMSVYSDERRYMDMRDRQQGLQRPETRKELEKGGKRMKFASSSNSGEELFSSFFTVLFLFSRRSKLDRSDLQTRFPVLLLASPTALLPSACLLLSLIPHSILFMLHSRSFRLSFSRIYVCRKEIPFPMIPKRHTQGSIVHLQSWYCILSDTHI